MTIRRRVWRAAAGAFCAAAMTVPGAASAMEVSGEIWGARDAGGCEPLRQRGRPNAQQATALIRCRVETTRGNVLYLMEDVRLQFGRGRAFDALRDGMTDIDVTRQVFPLTGTFTEVTCNPRDTTEAMGGNPDRNCSETDYTEAQGACWQNPSAEWQCSLGGLNWGPTRSDMPPPR